MIHTLRAAGVEETLVVIGPHVAELAPLARAAGADVLELAEPTPDMRSTVEHGLAWLEEHFHPVANDAWLLVPADHPVLDPAAVRQLLDAFRQQAGYSLAVPTFGGERGHPAVIAWQHVAGIRALPANLGLNAYLRRHAADTLVVPVESASVLFDLDTPEDYERLPRLLA